MKITETKLRQIVRGKLKLKRLEQLHEKMTGKVELDDEAQGEAGQGEISPDVLKFFEQLKSKSQIKLAAGRINTKQEKIDVIAMFMVEMGVEDMNMLTQALPRVKEKMKKLTAAGQG